jgi:hypothetical protein
MNFSNIGKKRNVQSKSENWKEYENKAEAVLRSIRGIEMEEKDYGLVEDQSDDSFSIFLDKERSYLDVDSEDFLSTLRDLFHYNSRGNRYGKLKRPNALSTCGKDINRLDELVISCFYVLIKEDVKFDASINVTSLRKFLRSTFGFKIIEESCLIAVKHIILQSVYNSKEGKSTNLERLSESYRFTYLGSMPWNFIAHDCS